MPKVVQHPAESSFVEFGQRVRALRQQRGWSIRQLAERAKMSPFTILRIEQGHPTLESKRIRVTDALGTSFWRVHAPHHPGDEMGELLVHKREYDVWRPIMDSRTHILPNDQELVQDDGERLRLGRLGFVPQFVRTFDCRRLTGRLVGGIIEVHHNLPAPSQYPGGEILAYALSGASVLYHHGEAYPLEEGEAVSFECSSPFSFGPAEGAQRPSLVLYVRLEEVEEGRDPFESGFFGWSKEAAEKYPGRVAIQVSR